MMDLYILRHGIAEERGGGPDSGRALTEEGRTKLRRVLQRAAKAGVAPSLILSSPYKRALQTAEIAAEALAYKQKIGQTQALLPEADVEDLWREIRAHGDETAILLAGHEPMLSGAVAWLLGVPGLQVDMKKGALVCVGVDHPGARPRGALKWMLTPRLAGGE
jgi:phosphohistidine phosphatase